MILEDKLKEIQKLSDVITSMKLVTRTQKGQIEDEETRLKFRLNELLQKSEKAQMELANRIKNEEADLKLASFQKVVQILQ